MFLKDFFLHAIALLVNWAQTTGRFDNRMRRPGISQTVVASDGTQHIHRTTGEPGMSDVGAPLVFNFYFDDPRYTTLSFDHTAAIPTAAGLVLRDRLGALEVFNGQRFVMQDFNLSAADAGAGGGGGGGGAGGAASVEMVTVGFATAQIDQLESAYAALRESVYASLTLQTRLWPYFDAIKLVTSSSGFSFDASGLIALLESKKSTDMRNAVLDLADLTRLSHGTLQGFGFESIHLLNAWIQALPAGSTLREELKDLDIWAAGDTVLSSNRNDIYLGDSLNNTYLAGAGDDVLNGGAGDDELRGEAGADVLLGEEGNDTLFAGADNDLITGGLGADLLYGEAGDDRLQGNEGDDKLWGAWGSDVLDGGVGNDYLSGGAGADTYHFGKGSGQDTLYNEDDDALGVSVDVIQLGAGIVQSDVSVKRDVDDLLISLAGSSDSLRVYNYFLNDAASGFAIESIRFADGASWGVDAVKSKVLTGTAAGEIVYGYASNDVISSGAGDDTVYAKAGDDTVLGSLGADLIYGEASNDTLQGNKGDDRLWGAWGNDVLDGGAGNDYLSGGAGADTYHFGKGSGQDSLYNEDTDAQGASIDTILLGAGITPSGVSARRESEALLIKINGSTDSLYIYNYFMNDASTAFAPEAIKFADGTIWNVATVKTKVLTGTAADDTLYGYASSDTINAAAGNDTLYAGAGNDKLQGGAGADTLYGDVGNDTLQGNDGEDKLYGHTGVDVLDGGVGADYLSGGTGADTYRFGRGSGADVIYENDAAANTTDVLSFGAGVTREQVWLSRHGDDLKLALIGTNDSVTVSGWYSGAQHQIERIQTSNGTLVAQQLNVLIDALAAFAPPAAGQTTLPADYQTVLNPVIAAGWK